MKNEVTNLLGGHVGTRFFMVATLEKKLSIHSILSCTPKENIGGGMPARRNQLLGRFGSAIRSNKKQSKNLMQPCHSHCFL